MTKKIVFSSTYHERKKVFMVENKPAPGEPITDFTRKAIHEEIFKESELEELLIAARAQNEPQELITHIEQALEKRIKKILN